jgi:hypothetical protein
MALSNGDFTEPEGELRPDMFPGVDDLEATDGYLDTWLNEAQNKSSEEEAQKHWVYHRAYKQVWLRLTTNPHDQDFEEDGSLKYSETQVESFKEMAGERREAFEEIEGETDQPQGREVRSQTVSSTTRWL